MNRAILHGVWQQCLKSLAVFLMYLLHSQLAFAAGGCGSASLPFGAVDSVSSSREGQFRIGSVTKYTNFDNFREGADAVTNPGGNRAIITESTLFVDVGLSKRWVVTALVPYIKKKQQTNRFGKRIANGIGDITLLDKCQDIVYTKMCQDIVNSLNGIRMLILIPYVFFRIIYNQIHPLEIDHGRV